MHRATVIGKASGLHVVARAALGVPAVRTGEHLLADIPGSGCSIELAGPWHPAGSIPCRPMQDCTGVACPLVRRRLIPIPPALALDVLSQPAIDQHGLGPLAPRTSQVNRIRRHILRGRKRAAVEHEAIRLPLGCRCRRHVAVHVRISVERADLAPLKIGTRAAKDKVDVALDSTASEILTPHPARRKLFGANKPARFDFARRQRAQKQRILAPRNAAGIDHQTIAVGIQGNRLPHLATVAGIVDDREVLEPHVVGIDQNGIGPKRAERAVDTRAILRGHPCPQAAHDAHAVGRLAHQRHMRSMNLDPLAILARIDMNPHRLFSIRIEPIGCRQGIGDAAVCPLTLGRYFKNLFFNHHQSLRPFVADRLRCSSGI